MAAKKIGRPTDNPKDIMMKIRFDKGTSEKLKKCSEAMKIFRAEVVQRGVAKMYDDLKENEKEVASHPSKQSPLPPTNNAQKQDRVRFVAARSLALSI